MNAVVKTRSLVYALIVEIVIVFALIILNTPQTNAESCSGHYLGVNKR